MATTMRSPSCWWIGAPRSTGKARCGCSSPATVTVHCATAAKVPALQFVGIDETNLSDVLTHLPSSPEDVDTDWEIEPDTLQMSERLGESLLGAAAAASAAAAACDMCTVGLVLHWALARHFRQGLCR